MSTLVYPWFVELENQVSNHQGKHALTVDGLACQRWDARAPHVHTNTDANKFLDATVGEAGSYYRR